MAGLLSHKRSFDSLTAFREDNGQKKQSAGVV